MSRHRVNDPDETAYFPKVVEPKVVEEPVLVAPGQGSAPYDLPFSPTFEATTVRMTNGEPPVDQASSAEFDEQAATEPVSSDPSITSVIPVVTADSTTVLPVFKDQPTDETTVIPVVPADPDGTTMLPRIPAADETGLLGAVPPAPPEEDGEAKPRPRWTGEAPAPVKAIKSGDGYRSFHAEYTRTTVGSVIRTTLRGTGELLITLGLVILMFAAYEVWGKTAIVEDHQAGLGQELDDNWELPEPTASPDPTTKLKALPGNGIARLYIPKIDKQLVVVEGVTQADIRYAPGHYPNSAMPGQKGNFAVAGHRNKAIFWNLHQLEDGDKIVVETKKKWYVYEVRKKRIVLPRQVEVVRPVPPGFEGGKLLTLTTCNPLYDNYERLIIHAVLVDEMPRSKDAPRPDVLEG